MAKRTSYYITDRLYNRLKLETGVSHSKAINKIIDRYDYLVESEKQFILSIFTKDEISFLKEIIKGIEISPAIIIRHILSEKVEGNDDIIKKLESLTLLQHFALIEILESVK